MKSIFKILCLFTVVLSVSAFSQVTGDYQSNATSGDWSVASIWQVYNGSQWVTASTPPTGSGTITIRSTDSIFINMNVIITGTLLNKGKLGGTGSLTIANGGIYQHDQNNGSLPECTWEVGSTCKVTGYISGSKPNNSNQNFYNFIWDCPNQTENINLGMNGNIIGGNFTVNSTGTGRLYLTAPNVYTTPITINGNIYVTGGQFASNGSSSLATIEVVTNGDIIVTGGNFSVSRGSGTDVYWRLYGDFSVTNATLQNSGGYTRIQKLIFCKNGIQNITLENVTYGTGTSPFTMEVENGTILNLGNTLISSSNSGSFILKDGSTLMTSSPGGIGANIQCTGASSGGGNYFSPAANFIFNGSIAQVTSNLMPDTVNNLTIDNSSGVALSKATLINGVLRLVSGVFDNTIPFTLGPSGSISYEGGSLLIPLSVDNSNGFGIPTSFFVDQNYPNPFNPATTLKFGIPTRSLVRVKIFSLLGEEISTLFDGFIEPGVHTMNFDAANLSSGVYIYSVQAGSNKKMKRFVIIK